MTLKEQIANDLTTAMKSKDEVRVSALRMLSSSIKNKQIELGKELNNEIIGQVVLKEIKQRKDSIIQFKKGGRDELAQKEESEIDILKKYMPEQFSKDKINQIISSAIKKTGAEGSQDMGKVMGVVMPELKGKADGSVVLKLVKESLSNL